MKQKIAYNEKTIKGKEVLLKLKMTLWEQNLVLYLVIV